MPPNIELIAPDELFLPVTVNSYYLVSNYGRVYSLKKRIIKKPYLDKYLSVMLYNPVTKKKKTYRIHRLVALAFVDNPDPEINRVVNHINEDKIDNRASNLEWTTQYKNNHHGTKNSRSSVTKQKPVYQFDLSMQLIKVWVGKVTIMKELGYCDKTIGYHCYRKNPYKGFYWLYETDAKALLTV